MSSELIQQLQGIVGPAGLITEPADLAPYLRDWRGNYVGKAPAVAPAVSPLSNARFGGYPAFVAVKLAVIGVYGINAHDSVTWHQETFRRSRHVQICSRSSHRCG